MPEETLQGLVAELAASRHAGAAGALYRLRGYTAAGRLDTETAALCPYHRGLVWAVWQGQYRMPAITPA